MCGGLGSDFTAYSDADLDDKSNDRRSVSETVATLVNAAAGWGSSTQKQHPGVFDAIYNRNRAIRR